MDFKLDNKIDEDALDVELLNQSELAFKYGKYWAECQRIVQQAEENIKLIRAQLIKEVNEDPENCLGSGIKPTGSNVESYYRNHDKHIKAKEDWVNACYELNIAEIAKKEISVTRKSCLNSLVELVKCQYIMTPTVPRDLTQEREKANKQINVKIARTLKRR